MRRGILAVSIVVLLTTPGPALIPARASVGFVSAVLDEGTEIVRAGTHHVSLLPWADEGLARSTERKIAHSWQELVSRIGQDWTASVAACWFCAPGGWPTLNVACVGAAREAVRARLTLLYQPDYWRQVETSLRQLPTMWWYSPRPGDGAVIACVAGESTPSYQNLLPDPYFHQAPRPPYPPAHVRAEPPGDPQKEALKELLLRGRPARVAGYQQIGYVVFLRTTGDFVPHTFTALVTGTCVQCVVFWCWPVTRTWTVTFQILLQRAVTDWPAVAEGYGIPGVL